MPIKYVGRTTTFKGKPLWEILANLKNHGVGRMVIRNSFQRYPEPTYDRILKVVALPDTSKNPHDSRKVMALVERTFRGTKLPKPVQIDSVTYKADYMLVPKDEEHRYLKTVQKDIKILPNTMEFPPLLKQILVQELKQQHKTEEPKLKLKYFNKGIKHYRVAKEGETPTVNLSINFGTPNSASMYANIKYDESP